MAAERCGERSSLAAVGRGFECRRPFGGSEIRGKRSLFSAMVAGPGQAWRAPPKSSAPQTNATNRLVTPYAEPQPLGSAKFDPIRAGRYLDDRDLFEVEFESGQTDGIEHSVVRRANALPGQNQVDSVWIEAEAHAGFLVRYRLPPRTSSAKVSRLRLQDPKGRGTVTDQRGDGSPPTFPEASWAAPRSPGSNAPENARVSLLSHSLFQASRPSPKCTASGFLYAYSPSRPSPASHVSTLPPLPRSPLILPAPRRPAAASVVACKTPSSVAISPTPASP